MGVGITTIDLRREGGDFYPVQRPLSFKGRRKGSLLW
jgi:hypothetical protein